MTDLETFAKLTLEQGGEWWFLEERGGYSIHCSKVKYICEHNFYYTAPVYQIFKDGTRIYTNTNYRESYDTFVRLAKKSEKWEEIENENK